MGIFSEKKAVDFMMKVRRSNYTWVQPGGAFTGLKLYNPMVKKKVPLHFNHREAPYLSWYSCGPTVYDSTHIGHAWLVKFVLPTGIL